MLPRLRTNVALLRRGLTTTGLRAARMSLASFVLLWSLTVTGTGQERLFGNQGVDQPMAEATVLRQRLPPLRDNGWAEQRQVANP